MPLSFSLWLLQKRLPKSISSRRGNDTDRVLFFPQQESRYTAIHVPVVFAVTYEGIFMWSYSVLVEHSSFCKISPALPAGLCLALLLFLFQWNFYCLPPQYGAYVFPQLLATLTLGLVLFSLVPSLIPSFTVIVFDFLLSARLKLLEFRVLSQCVSRASLGIQSQGT